MSEFDSTQQLKDALDRIDEGSLGLTTVLRQVEAKIDHLQTSLVREVAKLLAELDDHAESIDTAAILRKMTARNFRVLLASVNVTISKYSSRDIDNVSVTVNKKNGYFVDRNGMRVSRVFEINADGEWLIDGEYTGKPTKMIDDWIEAS